MPTRFSHTNIVTRDPERLAAFYTEVFGCEPSGPPRELAGEWLARGMGLPGAKVHAYHLALPGLEGDQIPTLELFSLEEIRPTDTDVSQAGLMHISFAAFSASQADSGSIIANGRASATGSRRRRNRSCRCRRR